MRSLSTTAVVITYNGERWIAEQLRSIMGQTHPVDEIVVADDASHDQTLSTVREVLAGWGGRVRVIERDHNVGVRANLESALATASGDVVFLCDQDDRWHPHKVARQVAEFDAPEVELAFSDATVVSDDGTAQQGLWDAVGFTRGLRARWAADPLGVLLAKEVVTGATLACRRELLVRALPIPRHRWHDSWLALTAVLTGGSVTAIPDALMIYRRHDANTAGLPSRRWVDRLTPTAVTVTTRAERIQQLRAARERYIAMDDGRTGRLRMAEAFNEDRLLLPARRPARVPFVTTGVITGRYWRVANGTRSAAEDLLRAALPPDLVDDVRAVLSSSTS